MSKMGQLHAELSEQAAELGFETVQDALNSGYTVDYDKRKLVKSSVMWHLDTDEYLAKEREKAHEAWLEERDSVIESLDNAIYHNKRLNDGKGTYEAIVMQRARDFIKEIKSE